MTDLIFNITECGSKTKEEHEATTNYFKDCMSCKKSDAEIGQMLYSLLIVNNQLVLAEKIMKATNYNVNQPYMPSDDFSDLMYEACKAGKKEVVELLLTYGYDGSNLINGRQSVLNAVEEFSRANQKQCISILKQESFISFELTPNQKSYAQIKKEILSQNKLLEKKERVTKTSTPEDLTTMDLRLGGLFYDEEKASMRIIRWARQANFKDLAKDILENGLDNIKFKTHKASFKSFIENEISQEKTEEDIL